MEGRQISHTIRTTLDISQFSKNITGYLLLLDFEKCFDRIEYSAIRGALQFFDFGENFIKWTDLLLNDFHSCTTNNGFFSEYINITRSCHQGCPATPYFFILCSEIMSLEIRENSNIHGIKIEDLEFIISQFADDTQLFPDSRKSLEEVIAVLNCIEANMGLKVNYEKSSIIRIGDALKIECSKIFIWDPGGPMVPWH